MRAFHNDPKIKDKYMARLQAHYAADEIVKGRYWEDGKGCAVGCTIHSDDHFAYETELGIPEALARLQDCVFEGLTLEKAKEFPIEFLGSVNVGSDLSLVVDKFLHWLLVDVEHGVIQYSDDKQAVQNVADLYQRKIDGETTDTSEWRAAAGAAYDAGSGYAAACAGAAAAYNAALEDAYDADAAARAADAAAYAADAAAYAADAAAYAAARAAAYGAIRAIQSEKLIELIKGTVK